MTFADIVLKKRWLTAITIAALSIAAVIGAMRTDFDDNPQNLFDSDNEEWVFLSEVIDRFGSEDNTCFLVVTADELFSPQSMTELRQLAIDSRRLDGVESVLSITSRKLVAFDAALRPLALPGPLDIDQLARAKERARQHPLIAGQMLSDDGKWMLIKVQVFGGDASIGDLQPVTDGLLRLADRYNQESTLTVGLTGIPAIRVEIFDSVQAETIRYTLLGAIAGFVMAVALMRRVATIFVVVAVSLFGALWTVGALGLIGEKLTVLTTVLPMLVLIIGLTDSVHITFDIRQSRASGNSAFDATHHAMRHLTLACLLTSVTTAVGFGSLYVTDVGIIRRFGLACAAGCGLTFLAVVTVLPFLASTRIGNGILPPRGTGKFEAFVEKILLRVVNLSLRFRWPITILGFGLAVWTAYASATLSPENQMNESLPEDARSIRALQTVDRHFGGIIPSFVVVDWPKQLQLESDELKDVLTEVHRLCNESDATNAPLSLLNLMKMKDGNLNRLPTSVVNSMASVDQHRAVVMTRTQDVGSALLSNSFSDLKRQLAELESRHNGFQIRLTGFGVLATRSTQKMIGDLAASLGLATVVIFVTMTIAYRSLRIGLICLLPNALPLLITAALLAVFDGTLRFSSVIVFSVCLGIAVDDTIHLVARFRRELNACRNVEQALRNSVTAVGSALIVTTGILVVGLSIPITSQVYANRLFGQLSCLAIVSALLADLILLPAMLACFVPNVAESDHDRPAPEQMATPSDPTVSD